MPNAFVHIELNTSDLAASKKFYKGLFAWEFTSPMPGYTMLDSLAVEQSGRICVAGGPEGGITVFEPDGHSEFHALPGEIIVTNICFGGDDLRDTWITASSSGRLYRTRWPRPGLQLNI